MLQDIEVHVVSGVVGLKNAEGVNVRSTVCAGPEKYINKLEVSYNTSHTSLPSITISKSTRFTIASRLLIANL